MRNLQKIINKQLLIEDIDRYVTQEIDMIEFCLSSINSFMKNNRIQSCKDMWNEIIRTYNRTKSFHPFMLRKRPDLKGLFETISKEGTSYENFTNYSAKNRTKDRRIKNAQQTEQQARDGR